MYLLLIFIFDEAWSERYCNGDFRKLPYPFFFWFPQLVGNVKECTTESSNIPRKVGKRSLFV